MSLRADVWVFGLVGSLFFVVGSVFVGVGWLTGRQADELDRLPILNVAELTQATDGTQGVIEGRIAERNPLQFRTFVTYIRSEYQGEDCDDDGCVPNWVENERKTPSLWLDLPDGRARLVNADYSLQHLNTSWESTPERIEYETLLYEGFEIGNPVFATGHVVRGSEDPAFHAQALYGGDRAGHVAQERFNSRLFLWLGSTFSFIGGGLVVVILGWMFRR